RRVRLAEAIGLPLDGGLDARKGRFVVREAGVSRCEEVREVDTRLPERGEVGSRRGVLEGARRRFVFEHDLDDVTETGDVRAPGARRWCQQAAERGDDHDGGAPGLHDLYGTQPGRRD